MNYKKRYSVSAVCNYDDYRTSSIISAYSEKQAKYFFKKLHGFACRDMCIEELSPEMSLFEAAV